MRSTTTETEKEGGLPTDFILTPTLIEALRTPKGGFTRALTDRLGVLYPYQKGWLNELKKEKRAITPDEYSSLKCLSKQFSKNKIEK